MVSFSALVVLAASLMSFDGYLALMVTSPSDKAAWNLKGDNTITWTSVATDPSTFDIVLVNNDASCASTGMSQIIKQNVPTADGKFVMSNAPSVKPCAGYQINLVAPTTSPTNGGGILAQSAQFTATDSATTPTNGTAANNGTSSPQTNSTSPAGTNSTMNSTSLNLSGSPVSQSYSGELPSSSSSTSKAPNNWSSTGSSSANNGASQSSTSTLIPVSVKSLVVNLMFTTFLLVALS